MRGQWTSKLEIAFSEIGPLAGNIGLVSLLKKVPANQYTNTPF